METIAWIGAAGRSSAGSEETGDEGEGGARERDEDEGRGRGRGR